MMALSVQPAFQGAVVSVIQPGVSFDPEKEYRYKIDLVPDQYQPSSEPAEARVNRFNQLLKNSLNVKSGAQYTLSKVVKSAFKELLAYKKALLPLGKNEFLLRGNAEPTLRFSTPDLGRLTELLEAGQFEKLKTEMAKVFTGSGITKGYNFAKNDNLSSGSVFFPLFVYLVNKDADVFLEASKAVTLDEGLPTASISLSTLSKEERSRRYEKNVSMLYKD